jgi:hypothetical protein
LFCHVHAYRVFLRELDPINAAARKAFKRWKDAALDLEKLEHDLHLKKRCLVRDKIRLDKTIAARDAYFKLLRIKKYAKKSRWTVKRTWFKDRLNSDRAKARSRRTTIMNKKTRIAMRKTEVEALKAAYWAKKQLSLQSARLVAAFKHLLDAPWNRFDAERVRLANVLGRSSLDIASKITRFLDQNPHVYATSKQDFEGICPPWLANTNTIEGIFGLCRPVLDKAKRFSRSRQSIAILDLLRLKHNLSHPNTGPRVNETPLQRAGVISRYDDYLDAIYPLNQLKLSVGDHDANGSEYHADSTFSMIDGHNLRNIFGTSTNAKVS